MKLYMYSTAQVGRMAGPLTDVDFWKATRCQHTVWFHPTWSAARHSNC